MGRGDSNILFNERLIRAPRGKKRQNSRGENGSFERSAGKLFLTPHFAVLRDMGSRLHYLDRDLKRRKAFGIPERIEPSAEVSVKNGKLAWGDGDGFIIEDLKDIDNPALYKESLPGPTLGLHVARDNLYAVALETEESWSGSLFRTSTEDESGWEEVPGYQHGNSFILDKGDFSLLFYQETRRGTQAFATLSSEGPGKIIYLPEFFNNFADPQNLMAPIAENKCLAIAENEEGAPEVRLLSIEPFAATGPAENRLVTELTHTKGIGSTAFKDMAASEGRALILGNEELILVDEKKILDIIPLDPEIDSDYTHVSFSGERAILWQEGYEAYQEFILSRR